MMAWNYLSNSVPPVGTTVILRYRESWASPAERYVVAKLAASNDVGLTFNDGQQDLYFNRSDGHVVLWRLLDLAAVVSLLDKVTELSHLVREEQARSALILQRLERFLDRMGDK